MQKNLILIKKKNILRAINFKLWTTTQENKIRNNQTRKIIFGGNFLGGEGREAILLGPNFLGLNIQWGIGGGEAIFSRTELRHLQTTKMEFFLTFSGFI